MASYGRFEVLRELCTGRAGCSVLVAKASGESRGGEVAVKIYSPPRTIIGRGAADRQLESFLARVRVAEQLGALAKSAWTPILESGRVENETFYVTRLYPRSAQALIDMRVRMNSQALLAIAQGVARGLGQIHTTLKRGHGNLKPSNVLITSPDRVNQSGIFLSDPETNERAGTGERGDLEALGHLLHELVVGTDAATGEDWSGPPDKAWSRLSGAAHSWRDLCKRLIYGSDDSLTIASLPAELRKIGAQRRLPVKSLVAMAVLLVVSGLAAGWEIEQRSKFQRQWDNYVTAYRTTVLPLKHLAGASQLQVRPEVAQELKRLNAQAVFTQDPNLKPDYFPPFENAGINQKLGQAVVAADGLRDLWKTDHWALRNGLYHHTQLAKDEFPKTATMFWSFVLERLDPLTEVSGTRIPDSLPPKVVDQVATASLADANADALLEQLAVYKKLGIGSADSELSRYYGDLVSKGATADLAKMLADLKSLAARVQGQAADDPDWKNRFTQRLDMVWDGPQDDPVARADQIFREMPLSQNTDPRAGISDKLRQLQEKIDASALPEEKRKSFSDKLKGIDTACRNTNTQWTPDGKEDARIFAESTLKQLSALDLEIASFKNGGTDGNPGGGSGTNANGGTSGAAIGSTGGNTGGPVRPPATASVNPPVNTVYNGQLEDGVPPEMLESRRQLRQDLWTKLMQGTNAPKDTDELNTDIKALTSIVNYKSPDVREYLSTADNKELGLTAASPAGAAHNPAVDELVKVLNAAAERNFIQRLEALSQNTPKSAVEEERGLSAFSAKIFLHNCSALLGNLDRFTGMSEQDITASLHSVDSDACYKDNTTLVNQLVPVLKLKAAMEPATKEQLIDQLRKGDQCVHEAVELIPWRRLADLDNWPDTPEHRMVEQASYDRLMKKFDKAGKVLVPIECDRAHRYLAAAVKQAAKPAGNYGEILEIQKWLTQLVTASPQFAKPITAEEQYDFALAALKKSEGSKEAVAAFLGNPFVQKYKDRSDVQSLVPKTAGAASASTGPANIPGCTLTRNPDGTMQLKYHGEYVLLFSYLPGSHSYMLRTDVSWTLFDRIMTLENGWDQVRGDFQRNVKNDGLSAWRLAAGPRLLPHDKGRWFEPVAQPNVPELVQALGEAPDDAPMNYLPPKAAQDAANLLKCRLPTLAEWKEACVLDHRNAPGYARPGDDRRGPTWVAKVRDEQSAVAALRDTTSFGFCPCLMTGVFQNIRDANRSEDGVVLPPSALLPPRTSTTPDNTAFFRGVNEGLFKDQKVRGKPEEVSPDILNPFSDLVGNVAQYVTNDAAVVGVVGASALSPADATVEFQPLPPDYEKRGFSDVGFRLVYDAPANAPGTDVRKYVTEMPFLPL